MTHYLHSATCKWKHLNHSCLEQHKMIGQRCFAAVLGWGVGVNTENTRDAAIFNMLLNLYVISIHFRIWDSYYRNVLVTF